ncbi:MAG: extracellular solute-binding protein [Ruminococcus sp.]|nr:extracellular solute-binding protein [Ruminococcus sp.]
MSIIKKSAVLVCLAMIMSNVASCSSVKSDSSAPSDFSAPSDSSVSDGKSSDEKKDDIVLTLAMSGDSSGIEKTIEEFNAADNGCQVQIKRYSEQFDEDGLPITQSEEESQYQDLEILQDIINTTEIDIVCNVSFTYESNYQILQNKGAFVDLYSFMENDPEVNTDTLDTHILEVNEIDGKLYTLPDFYNINTLVGESQYVGTKENWTFDEFVEHWNAMPEGSTIAGANQAENIYSVVLRSNLSGFIDYENAQVHFDSPNFKKMLEFCNQFESTNGEKGTYDYDAPNFVWEGYSNGIMASSMFNPDNGFTCVGYPSEDGNGAYFTSAGYSYSINAKASPEKQQAAWEFIRTFVTEEWQVENVIPFVEGSEVTEAYYSTELGYCVNKNAFDKIAEKIINKEYYSLTMTNKDVEYERRFPNEEDVVQLRRYIDSVNRWETVVGSSVWNIVNEEVLAYFAGEISVDECIERIQNRASIWISEQS